LDDAFRRGRKRRSNQHVGCSCCGAKTFNDEAAGGKIVRVEKEESNYEAVIEKDGKQTGVEVSADGKVVSRHDEKKEDKEKGEKDEKY